MGMWKVHAARAAIISLLCLVAAVVPGAGFFRAVPPAATRAIDVAVAAEYPDELPGMVNQHLYGTPIPTPAPTADTTKLLLAELTTKKAPVPSGPVTYVPILLYHYIRVNPNPRDRVGFSLSTPPAMFRMQMQYLADHGFHVVSLHEAVVAIAHHTGLPSRPVVLTFDDGYADFFTQAVPVLLSHGFTATDFVVSGRMGWGGFMTASQVLAADNMGFNIGAHTVDHVALGFLAPARATWEMRQSKATLEALLGHSVLDFAYPYGSFNYYVMGQARSLGFETAVSTLAGTVHTPGQLYELSRMRIGGGLSLGYFAYLVAGPPPTAAELRGAGAPPTPPPTATPHPSPTPPPTPAPTPTPTSTPSAMPSSSKS